MQKFSAPPQLSASAAPPPPANGTAGAGPRVGMLLGGAHQHHAGIARQLMRELADNAQFSIYDAPADAHAAIDQLDLLLDFGPAGAPGDRSAEAASKTVRYLSGEAAAAGKAALSGARAFIVEPHAVAARHVTSFPALVPLARGVDYSVFHTKAYRQGPMTFGWVGDTSKHALHLVKLLMPVMADLTICTIGEDASDQQLANFYNIIDVVVILSDAEYGAQTMLEAMACGVFPLVVGGTGLPECIRRHNGGLSIDVNVQALRNAMLWCVDNSQLVRQGGAQNAQAVALHYNWQILAPRWLQFLQAEIQHAAAGHRRSAPPCDLLLLDDIFPLLLSAFRIMEYNAYLSHFPTANIQSTGASFLGKSYVNIPARSFDEVKTEYEARYPAYAGRVTRYDPGWLPDARLAYLIFINNAYDFCAAMEASNMPFVFCLYPGGGFHMDNPVADHKLQRVFASPCFRKVLCTQKISYDYLLRKGMCPPEKIEYLFGGVVPTRTPSSTEKYRYKENKATFNICFVASKYSPQGRDKGYDLFIAVAKILAARHDDIFFHVVGNFDSTEIDVAELAGKISFHGMLSTDALGHFFRDMEIMLSPNRAFVLLPGAFDGFPTGAGAEAGINEVALFTSDPLQLNPFADGEEIVIIDTDADSIVAAIEPYYAAPERLYQLAARGAQRYAAAFHPDAQIAPRIRLLEQQLALLPAVD